MIQTDDKKFASYQTEYLDTLKKLMQESMNSIIFIMSSIPI
jgi:hypothetical protein